jgi:hypothetical protein
MHVTEFGAIDVLMNIARVTLLRAAGWHPDDLTSWGQFASYAVSALIATSILHVAKRLRTRTGDAKAATASNTMSVTEYGCVSMLMSFVRMLWIRTVGWNPNQVSSVGSVVSYFVSAAVAMTIYQAIVGLLARSSVSTSRVSRAGEQT